MSSKLVSKELWPDQWYISDGENTHGPLTAIETFSTFQTISQLFNPGINTNHDHLLVSRKGFSTWYHYRDLQYLYTQGRIGKDSVVANLKKDLVSEIDRLKDLMPKTKNSHSTFDAINSRFNSSLRDNQKSNVDLGHQNEDYPIDDESTVEAREASDHQHLKDTLSADRVLKNDFDPLFDGPRNKNQILDESSPSIIDRHRKNVNDVKRENPSRSAKPIGAYDRKASLDDIGFKTLQTKIDFDSLRNLKNSRKQEIEPALSMNADDFSSLKSKELKDDSQIDIKFHQDGRLGNSPDKQGNPGIKIPSRNSSEETSEAKYAGDENLEHSYSVLKQLNVEISSRKNSEKLVSRAEGHQQNFGIEMDGHAFLGNNTDSSLHRPQKGSVREQILLDQVLAEEHLQNPLIADLKDSYLNADQLKSQIAKVMARDSVSFGSSKDGLSYVNMLAKSRLRLGEQKNPLGEAIKACFWLTLPSLYSQLVSEISWHVDPSSSKSRQISSLISLIPILNLLSFYKVMKVLMTAESQNQYRKISFLWGLTFAVFPPAGIFYLQRHANRHWQLHLHDYLKKM